MREEHVGAVHAAKMKMGEVQEILAIAIERAEEATTMVAMATGGSACGSQNGRSAFEKVSLLKDRINDAANIIPDAGADLDAYLSDI